jgi:hypothetical protein
VSALTAALVLLSGCTPAAPLTTVSPTPVPTFQCTPEAGGTPSPCSQAEFEQMQKMDALYAEAERVYRKYLAEDERVAKQGGALELTTAYRETIGDPLILQQTLQILRNNKKQGRHMRGGEFRIAWLKRRPEVSSRNSVVALRACVDASSSRLYVKDKYLGQGAVYEEESFFNYFGDSLQISNLSYELVESCAE